MTNKLKILKFLAGIMFGIVVLATNANAQCAAPGWASQNGGTVGGGTAAATVVSTYSALKTAITSATVKVVHISGTITFPAAGRITIQDQTSKSIIGLPGAKLISVDLTAGGSGIFYIKRCNNIIFKNIIFEGPGAYDTDGNDNMTIDDSRNIWVDHCDFRDGMDGNFDIKNMSDFITATYCKFSYSKAPIPNGPGGADDHRYTSLFGSSDGATGDRGKLRVTMQYCWWGQGCRERMPRVRFGKIHLVNNLYNSTVANHCIRAGFEADLLVESNVFENTKTPIDLYENNFKAITSRNNLVSANTTGNSAGSGTSFIPPYNLTISVASQVKAIITSEAGATLATPTNCGVTTTNTPPTVSLTGPANGALFTAPASIAITANAADANGTVSTVQFYNGTTLLGTDATAPYSFSWTAVAAGTYTLTAKATDNAGATTTSSSATIVVNGSTINTPPTVSLTAPSNGASFTSPATIAITANAADANGTVSNVQFYNGTTLLGTDATAPYSFNWSAVAAGTYILTAKATDNAGAATTSSGLTIVVNGSTTNTPPTVSLTAPSNGASFTAPATIAITANAADANGTVVTVQFYNGTTLLGTDATSPYSFNWTTIAAGNYTITARATDNAGSVTISTPVTISVTTVVTTTSGIISADCASSGQVISLQLSADVKTNATSYSWWYTGSNGAIASASSAAALTAGSGFGSGEVCVGINYNAAPWWKQYCKKITICNARDGFGFVEVDAKAAQQIYPNPSEESFTLSSYEGLESAILYNMIGEEVLKLSLTSGNFGKELKAGTYMLHLNYNYGKKEIVKIVKLK